MINLDIFRSQILNEIFDNDDSIRKTAEDNFYALLDENPCFTLQLLIENSNTDNSSSLVSITLLGSAAQLFSDKLIEIGDDQFHHDFQSSLLMLLQNSFLPPRALSNASFIISRYSKIYYPNWPSLLENLYQIIQSSDQPSYAIDCLNYCINNNSIACDDQVLEALIQLIQSILDTVPDLIPQFLSAMKLLFTIYQYESIDETFKSNLKIFSEKIVGVNIDDSDEDLHDRYMIELSNFADDNIDFFEPSLESLVDLLASKICSQQFSENAENSSVLVLKYIFCNKKYTNEFQAKSIEVYDLLVKLISTKLPEAEIDPEEGESALNVINIISNAKDTIKSIAHNYGGFDDVSIYLITSFYEEQTDDFELFISNFISFGCVINEIIDFIDPYTFLSNIIPTYKLGFSNQSIDCRYRSIVSLRKVIKALGNYRIDIEWDSQEIITLIFETLSEESCQANITALLLALKASLSAFKDYHDNIENIILPLDQNFDSFTLDQQSIIISCYSCCCLVCDTENDPYAELMLGILNRIISVLRDGYQSELGNFYFSCLDAALDFDKFVSSSELFNELSPIVLEFISSFDSIPNQDESTPTMMDFLENNQIDIMNRTLRSLLSLCPENEISDFSAQVFQPIFILALADIEPEIHSFEESKSDLQTNYEIIKDTEENSWICYSKNTIRNISEALRTIHSILEQSPEIIDHLFDQIIEIIEKWINSCFSFSLVNKCAQILCLLFDNQKMKQQQTEPFILGVFIKLINAFDLIDDFYDNKSEENGKKTISFIQLFNRIFEFIGRIFNSPDSLAVVVGGEEGNNPNPIDLIIKLHSKWSELHQMCLSSSSEDKNNLELQQEFVRVEKKIGSMFDPIFKYYSYPETFEKLNPLMMQLFPIDETEQFFTPTFFGFWSSMAANSSLCAGEQIVKICSFFGEILINGFDCFPLYVAENAAESIIKIANSGRIPIDFFMHLIEILEESVSIYKEKNDCTVIDNLLIPNLLILIENVNKDGINLDLEEADKIELISRLIALLLACLPVSFLIKSVSINKSARCLLSILSMNHPILNDANNMAKICSLALLFIIVYKPPVLKQLILFVKSVFFDEQGQSVYNELLELPLSQRFGNDCIEFIKEMTE